MHLELDLDLLAASSLTEYERARIASVRDDVRRQLPTAELHGEIILGIGDCGGQTYFTIPANRVCLTAKALAQLIFDIDHLYWYSPDNVHVRFDRRKEGALGGGMGEHRIVDGLWLHDVICDSAFGRRIADVLSGTRPRIWPYGSAPHGEPRRPDDMLDLLAEEDGRGPAFELMRAIRRRCANMTGAAFAARAAYELRRFLDVESPRNRIQAALALVDRAEPEALVRAVYDGVAGTIGFPPWGCWEREAGIVLGDLMRRGEAAAWDAFEELAAEPGWIERHGQWLIVDWTHYDERLTDPRNFMDEIRTLRGRRRVRGVDRMKLPTGRVP